jgi:hypothetical protein
MLMLTLEHYLLMLMLMLALMLLLLPAVPTSKRDLEAVCTQHIITLLFRGAQFQGS